MCSYNILLNNWTANQTNSLNLNITYSVGLMLNFLPPFPLLLLCRLNILVVGGASGCVELYAYGMYRIATLDKVRELYLRSDLVTPISSRGPLGLSHTAAVFRSPEAAAASVCPQTSSPCRSSRRSGPWTTTQRSAMSRWCKSSSCS